MREDQFRKLATSAVQANLELERQAENQAWPNEPETEIEVSRLRANRGQKVSIIHCSGFPAKKGKDISQGTQLGI